MNAKRTLVSGVAAMTCAIALTADPVHTNGQAVVDATGRSPSPRAELLVSGLEGASGSAIGPDGALYVTEATAGRITRVDPRTGSRRTFASGLPKQIIGLGGATDLVFSGRTAYVLVTLVGPDVGGTDTVGIYRVDGRNRFTPIADIGKFALDNPPATPFDVPTGLQFAIDVAPGGFIVTDGHHNRVLLVTLDGRIRVVTQLDNVVPTGIAVLGTRVFIAQAGPLPHLPSNGEVMLLARKPSALIEIASGARLLVDVEAKDTHSLYALSQGVWPAGGPPASPALPNTGALVRVNWDGTFTTIATHLNQPTSLEFIGDRAFIVGLAGEIWTIDLDRHDR